VLREASIHRIEHKLDAIIANQEEIMTQQATIVQQLQSVQIALNSVASGITALDADIQKLNDQIAANSGDNLTPATQALLSSIVSQSASLATQANTLPSATVPAPPPTTTP
jgi:uncharacterized protein YoxC